MAKHIEVLFIRVAGGGTREIDLTDVDTAKWYELHRDGSMSTCWFSNNRGHESRATSDAIRARVLAAVAIYDATSGTDHFPATAKRPSRIRVFRRVANVDDIDRAALCSTKPNGHRRFFTTLSRTIRTFAPVPTLAQAREIGGGQVASAPSLRVMRRSFVAGLCDTDLAASIRANRGTLQDISFHRDATGWASHCIYLALYRAELRRRATKPLPPSDPIGDAVEDRNRARDALAQAGAPGGAFQVNTIDAAGDMDLHLGFFPNVSAARAAIAAHLGRPLGRGEDHAGDGAPIVETWTVGGVAHVIQDNQA